MTTTWSWRKSSRSATSGQCVEVGTDTGAFGVRDSKLGDWSPVLTFGPGAMAAFVATVKHGGFDTPA